jgi:hypothetical protein
MAIGFTDEFVDQIYVALVLTEQRLAGTAPGPARDLLGRQLRALQASAEWIERGPTSLPEVLKEFGIG